MGRRRYRLAQLLTVIAGAAVALVPGAAPATAAPPGQPAGRSGGTHTVTLITGDRVVLTGRGDVSVTRGVGRAHMRFNVTRHAGHVHVVPVDAMPMIASGQVDPRLFDVTLLAAYGYDERRGDLPLIVTGDAAAATVQRAATAGGHVVRALPSIGATAVRTPYAETGAFWASLIAPRTFIAAGSAPKVWLDGRRQLALDVSVAQIGATTAHQAGFTGAGVAIAVLDSGADVNHPDLVGQIAARANFTAEDDRDVVGHGTHVASTIAGTGAASAGRFRGVAPGARLHIGKVCERFGCTESALLAGMEWAAAQQGVKIVNMSLGGPDTPGLDPIEQAVQTLTAAHGTLFVIAAGNRGADASIESPGSADAALTVGAVSKTEELADFSSRGPRLGDGGLKPDITGPGVAITAARSADMETDEPPSRYFVSSGTSMATPHVAGAAAILAQRNPQWTAETLKAALMGSANPNPTIGVFAQGAGRVDAARGIGQTVVADPPSVGFGSTTFPHDDDAPIIRTVTYRNTGAATVTLDLTVTAGVPAGMFTVNPASVSLPAGGQASVTVTADTSVPGPNGFVGGYLTATAGGVVVRTPIAVDREPERYDLAIDHLNAAGTPSTRHATSVMAMDRFEVFDPPSTGGAARVRLRPGRYTIVSTFFGVDGEMRQIVYPGLELTADRRIVLDARIARPVSVTVPRSPARSVLADVTTAITGPDFAHTFTMLGTSFAGILSGQAGNADRRVDGLLSTVNNQWAIAGADGSIRNSPTALFLLYHERGRLLVGLRKRVDERDLATVRATHAKHVSGQLEKQAFGRIPGVEVGGIAQSFPIDPPFTRTERYNTDAGVLWGRTMYEGLPVDGSPFPDIVATQVGLPISYRAGQTTHESWNEASYGPCFPSPRAPAEYVTRSGNQIVVSLPTACDAAGHIGFSTGTAARTALFRDGVLVGEFPEPGTGEFEVPSGTARFRLEAELERGEPFTLATRTSSVWTFRSGHVAGDRPEALPLSAIRFQPILDNNTAPSGRLTILPISVARQPDSSAAVNRRLSVEVSYDDGLTWTDVPVLRLFTGGIALVAHPPGERFVSLRAQATDAAGNTVEQTTIRAYRIARR